MYNNDGKPQENARHLRDGRGELVVSSDAIMEMAGFGPEAKMWEITSHGFVYLAPLGRRLNDSPYLAREVRHEAHLLMSAARQWIKVNAPALKRHLKMDVWQAYLLWKTGRKADIIRVKVGETVKITQGGGSYFGSGGSWGRWQEFGVVTKKWVSDADNGFRTNSDYNVTFDSGPAAVYTAAGDGINGGRISFRTLYIAE